MCYINSFNKCFYKITIFCNTRINKNFINININILLLIINIIKCCISI